jgi:hypothetical protein
LDAVKWDVCRKSKKGIHKTCQRILNKLKKNIKLLLLKIIIISFLITATAFNFTECKLDAYKEDNKTEEIENTNKSSLLFAVVNAEK